MILAEKISLIEHYLDAYNRFDLDGMRSCVHPDILFTHISGGKITVKTQGSEAFFALAQSTGTYFSHRKQCIQHITEQNHTISLTIRYDAELAKDLPNGYQAGDQIHIDGIAEYSFKDQKIHQIIDICTHSQHSKKTLLPRQPADSTSGLLL